MSMIGKKSIRQIEVRKPIAVSRLIKCYVCNQHFETQKQFDVHLQQHQNKLAKTNIEEIQRKTQESFRSKKQLTSLNKTQLLGQQNETLSTIETKEKPSFPEKEEDVDEKEKREIEEALRESQILLQKIEFMTQVAQPQQQKMLQPQKQDDLQQIKKWISSERELFTLISKSDSKASIEKLILETNFEEKYFENYQEQLQHLRLLASVAINPASISKIIEIRKNICRDVYADLQKHFANAQEKEVKNRAKTIKEPKLQQNKGEVRFCADCYSNIGGSDQFYFLSCGHTYHLECWNGECC